MWSPFISWWWSTNCFFGNLCRSESWLWAWDLLARRTITFCVSVLYVSIGLYVGLSRVSCSCFRPSLSLCFRCVEPDRPLLNCAIPPPDGDKLTPRPLFGFSSIRMTSGLMKTTVQAIVCTLPFSKTRGFYVAGSRQLKRTMLLNLGGHLSPLQTSWLLPTIGVSERESLTEVKVPYVFFFIPR